MVVIGGKVCKGAPSARQGKAKSDLWAECHGAIVAVIVRRVIDNLEFSHELRGQCFRDLRFVLSFGPASMPTRSTNDSAPTRCSADKLDVEEEAI